MQIRKGSVPNMYTAVLLSHAKFGENNSGCVPPNKHPSCLQPSPRYWSSSHFDQSGRCSSTRAQCAAQEAWNILCASSQQPFLGTQRRKEHTWNGVQGPTNLSAPPSFPVSVPSDGATPKASSVERGILLEIFQGKRAATSARAFRNGVVEHGERAAHHVFFEIDLFLNPVPLIR